MNRILPADEKTAPATAHGAHAIGLAEWLARRAARVPHAPALTCDGVTWNYGELVQRVECMSGVLAAGGVTPEAFDRAWQATFTQLERVNRLLLAPPA